VWRKRGKGEGISTRNRNSKNLLSELGPAPYHQQETGLFRNTMIAPATHASRRRGRPLTAQVRWAPRHGDGPFVFPSAPLRCGQMVRPQGSRLLLSPPWGRALRLPFGSASLRTNGPSPRLLFAARPATDRQRRRPLHRASARVRRLTPHSSRLTIPAPGPYLIVLPGCGPGWRRFLRG